MINVINNKNLKGMLNKNKGKFLIHIFFIGLCFISFFAFMVVIGSSFQSQSEIYDVGYRAFPKTFSLEAYSYILNQPMIILRSYLVTIVTTLIGALGGLWLTSTCGYVLSRRDYPYRRPLSLFVLFTMLFNGGLVATYIVNTQWLHLYDSVWALILPLMVSPWNIMLMKSFFSDIPTAVIESAKIDGAGEFQIFTRFVIPLSKPVFAAVGLFLTLTYWNDYMESLLYIESESLYKLQYLLMKLLKDMEFLNSAQAADTGAIDMLAQNIPSENARMAMCIIAAGPMLVIFPFFQKYFSKGLSLGAVKG